MPVLSDDDFASFGAPAAAPSPYASPTDKSSPYAGPPPKVLNQNEFESFGAPATPVAAAPKPPAQPRDPNEPESYATDPTIYDSTAYKALMNVPHSAVEFGKNIVQPILHPIDTAESLKNLGLGVLEKAGVKSGSEHTQYADAVGKFFADRYGGIENARKTLETDPVGMAGDLSMLLTGGGSAAARLPGVVGRIGDVAATAGRVVDPLRAVAPIANAAGRVAGRVGSEFLGATTGAGPLAIEHAAASGYQGGQGGQLFRDNMRRADGTMPATVADARNALDNMRRERGDAYRTAMARDVNPDATILNFNDIDRAVTNAQGVKTYRGRSGTAQEQNLHPRTDAIRTDMENAIEHWRGLDPAEFHSAEGIDALKQQLGNIRDGAVPGTPERVAADRIYGAVRQTIVDQVPAYARIMHGYEQASNQLREIEKTLSLNRNATIDTALRKLQSTLRDNVNTSFGRRGELANYLVNAGAPHLMERLAGQSLSSWTPRGLQKFVAAANVPAIGAALVGGAPLAAAGAAAVIPTMSPRLMGEVLHGTARAARRIRPITSNMLRPSRVIGESMPYGDMPGTPYQQP